MESEYNRKVNYTTYRLIVPNSTRGYDFLVNMKLTLTLCLAQKMAFGDINL